MSEIKDSGERTEFSSGAVRDMHGGKGRMDLLPMCAILRLSKHYENGCEKYGERNWEKGIPAHSYVDSALRHIMKYMDGYDDEDHLAAALWNLCGLAWTEEKKPEQMDIPAREGKKNFCYNQSSCLTCENHMYLPLELPCGSCVRSNSPYKTDVDYYREMQK